MGRTVLIPALGDTARRRLSAAGFEVLAQIEYLEVVDARRASFVERAPDAYDRSGGASRARCADHVPGAVVNVPMVPVLVPAEFVATIRKRYCVAAASPLTGSVTFCGPPAST